MKIKINLWIPNLFSFKGGIQVFSELLIKGLQNKYPDNNYNIFIKHDTKNILENLFLANTYFYFAGAVPLFLRTTAFAVQLIS